MSGRKHLFTSESVTEGHPDKLADQISDAVLDTIMAKDKQCRVACETLVTTGLVVIAGEITANCQIEMPEVARSVIREVGYDSTEVGFDWKTCSVVAAIDKQSVDIAQGVDKGKGLHSEQGAGDQGLMFGYACTETEELMPMPISYAHLLTRRLAEVRKNGTLPFIRPDGKSQVSVEYQDDVPRRIDTIVISTQHSEEIEQSALKEAVIEEVIRKVIPSRYLKTTKYFINPTGRFVLGGPRTDTGLTGRKIIVDSYGGMGRMGGGAFSGKDPSKVDRSAAYMARYIAKNIVAAGLATRCEVQFAYAIGVARPVSVFINTLGTGVIPDQQIERIVDEMFDLRPAAIIATLDLLRPIYLKTASYGHFRAEPEFTWENADRAEELRDRCGLGPLQTEKAACGS